MTQPENTRTLTDLASTFASNLPSFLAAVSGASLFLSIIHEVAYYWVVSTEFLALLDATDYIKQALYWLPFAIIFNPVNLLIYRLYNGISKGKIIAVASDSYSIIRRRNRLSRFRMGIIFALSGFAVIYSVVLFLYEGMMALGVFLFAISLPISLVISWMLGSGLSNAIRTSVFLGVGVFSFAIGSGLAEAYVGLGTNVTNFEIQLSDPDSSQRVVILRLIGRGAIVRHPDKETIEFIPSDRIKAISTVRNAGPSQSGA